MSEKKQVMHWAIKNGICFTFALLYSMGGSEDFGGIKALRRYVAPIILFGGMFYYSGFSWKALVGLPFSFASLSLGYGGTDLEFLKIIKRGVYGLANGITTGLNDLLNKRFIVSVFHILLLMAAYISFGVYNPFPDARIEEGVLGFLVAFLPVMNARPKSAD